MKPHHIHPIYFPTTTIFVDDSQPFLENLSLQLDPNLAFSLYHSPSKALEFVNSRDRGRPFSRDYFSRYADSDDLSSNNCVIDVDVDKIHCEVYNSDRFAESSVIVVDYVMPEMSGLDFCRRVRLPGVKKILLTGKADENLAVRAFNEGLIDRFITKNDSDALTTLNRLIVELQDEYFTELGAPLANILAAGVYGFLQDPAFAQVFDPLRKDRGIVEYYLCCNPEGILMVNTSGVASLLIVSVEDDLQAYYEIAMDQAAPQALLDALSSRKFIPYFWETNGHYDPTLRDWQSMLYPARQVAGQHRYYYAIVDLPPPFLAKPILAHSDYLIQLDQSNKP